MNRTRTLVLAAALAAAGSGCRANAAKSEPVPSPRVRTAESSRPVELRYGCTPTGPERCFDARDDNCNGIIDEGCGVATGLLQFTIAWNKAQADVDLEVTDPAGELAEVERASQTGLVKERDCPGRNSECQGQNLENVYLEGSEAARGRYRVKVRLDQLGPEEPPVRVRLGARVGQKTFAAELNLSEPGEDRELIFDL